MARSIFSLKDRIAIVQFPLSLNADRDQSGPSILDSRVCLYPFRRLLLVLNRFPEFTDWAILRVTICGVEHFFFERSNCAVSLIAEC